jgi:hypothetical protein
MDSISLLRTWAQFAGLVGYRVFDPVEGPKGRNCFFCTLTAVLRTA